MNIYFMCWGSALRGVESFAVMQAFTDMDEARLVAERYIQVRQGEFKRDPEEEIPDHVALAWSSGDEVVWLACLPLTMSETPPATPQLPIQALLRHEVATRALAGILASGQQLREDEAADTAVAFADELIARLSK